MYAYQINEMVECLVTSNVVASEKAADAQKALSNYWIGKIALTWQADDVRKTIADKLRVSIKDVFLSDIEADEILQSVLETVSYTHLTLPTIYSV